MTTKDAKKYMAYTFEEEEEDDTLFIAKEIVTSGDFKGLLRVWIYIPDVEVLEVHHIFPDTEIKPLTYENDMQKIVEAVFEFEWMGY